MEVWLHSYTFREQGFEEVCRAAADFRYDGIELQRAHFNEDYLERELPERMATAAEFGVAIRCVDFTADFMSDDPAVRDASRLRLERHIRICAEHGVGFMNGHTGVLLGGEPEDFGANGSAAAEELHYERAENALSDACSVADDCGVVVSLEIHMNTLHDSLASAARILDGVGSMHLRVTPDAGNQFATPHAEKGTDGLREMAAQMGLVHLKNCRLMNGQPDYSVGLSDGDIDLRETVHFLTTIGYTGPFCIEHVGELDARASAESDIAALRSWLAGSSST